MRAFLVFVATVVIAVAVAMPDHFREGVHHVQYWIERAVSAIF
jgi:hypothetical protein